MSENRYLYTLIQIPKSGSRTLGVMIDRSLPANRHFHIPQLYIDRAGRLHPAERFRATRRAVRGLIRYRALNRDMIWRIVSRQAQSGDIISGHLPYGKPRLPGWDLRYITILRNPVDRAVSEYYYSRQGYLSRPRWRQLYRKGLAEVTGTGSFTEYLRYISADRQRFGNPATYFATGNEAHEDPFSFLRERYFHFGILERMDLFSNQLAEKLGTAPHEVWENKTRIKEDYRPTGEDLELMHSLFARDIEFYERAREYILSTG